MKTWVFENDFFFTLRVYTITYHSPLFLSITHSLSLSRSFSRCLEKNNTSEALPSLTYILQRMALATFTTQQADNSHFLQYFTIMDLIQ